MDSSYFRSGVSTLEFGEWGVLFHLLALCLLVECRSPPQERRFPLKLSGTLSGCPKDHINMRITQSGSKAQYRGDQKHHGL